MGTAVRSKTTRSIANVVFERLLIFVLNLYSINNSIAQKAHTTSLTSLHYSILNNLKL